MSELVSFRPLQLANEQRSTYGLRYNDYTRYRKHCANRTHRLRSSLKATHGKGREFKKLAALTLENIKPGHLQLLLYEAERAWAYSQDLTAQAREPSNSSNARTLRHSATGRFRRTVHWATEMLSHCQALYAAQRLSASDLIEATAYTLLTNGRFLRYRDEFDDAIVQLAVSRRLLDALAAAARTSRDQALATLFADEVAPEIRYCAHELGSARAFDVDGIVKHFSDKHAVEMVDGFEALLKRLESDAQAGDQDAARRTLSGLEWEGEPVPVRNPELVDVLLRVQYAQAKLRTDQTGKGKGAEQATSGKRGVAAYDAILSALSDAEEVARKLAESQKLSGSSTAPSAGGSPRDLQFVHAYIVYQLLSRRIERDMLLVSALLASSASASPTKASDQGKKQEAQVDARLYPAVVKLFDTILQSLEQMRTLSIVDDSPDLATAVEARVAYTKARRCLFLERSYVTVKKFAEALALSRLATLHIREARSSLTALGGADPISSSGTVFYSLSTESIDTLDNALATDSRAHKMQWFALNGGAVGGAEGHKKPLFFDIALNYVALDMDVLNARAGKTPTPAIAVPAKTSAAQAAPTTSKTKAEEDVRAVTPEPASTSGSGGGGLGGLLGGWWGRK